MPYRPSPPPTRLVLTLLQDNLGHESIQAFEGAARAALESVEGISLVTDEGKPLPHVVVQSYDPPRRLAAWVAMTNSEGSSLEQIRKRAGNAWVGQGQPGSNRQYIVGNGYSRPLAKRPIGNIYNTGIYDRAFREIGLACSGTMTSVRDQRRDHEILEVSRIVDFHVNLLKKK